MNLTLGRFNLKTITSLIILLNIILFCVNIFFKIIFGAEFINNYLALNPLNLFSNFYFWTLITSMFLHANLIHLFVNMFSLFFIGRYLERIIGWKRFITLYLLSGVFAGLFSCSLAFYFSNSIISSKIFGDSFFYAIGASGAIFALAGVLSVLIPNKRVYLIAGPIVAIALDSILGRMFPQYSHIISILSSLYMILAIYSLFSFNEKLKKISLYIELPFWILAWVAIIPLMIIDFFVELPIGNMAHLGGLLFGLAQGFYLVWKYPKKTEFLRRNYI